MHTVKGSSVVNEIKAGVFPEFPCFLYDPVSVGNWISGSSAFSKVTELHCAQKCWRSPHSSTWQYLLSNYHLLAIILRTLGHIREQQRILILNREGRQQISRLPSMPEGGKELKQGQGDWNCQADSSETCTINRMQSRSSRLEIVGILGSCAGDNHINPWGECIPGKGYIWSWRASLVNWTKYNMAKWLKRPVQRKRSRRWGQGGNRKPDYTEPEAYLKDIIFLRKWFSPEGDCFTMLCWLPLHKKVD